MTGHLRAHALIHANVDDESITRSPDLTGDFVPHLDVSTYPFSPGRTVDLNELQ